MTMELNKIYCMDAIEFMKQIEYNSVDMILVDLPYGTTALACLNTGRNFICNDNNKSYVEIANKRLNEAKEQIQGVVLSK